MKQLLGIICTIASLILMVLSIVSLNNWLFALLFGFSFVVCAILTLEYKPLK